MSIKIPHLVTNNKRIDRAFRIAYSDIISNVTEYRAGALEKSCEVILAGMDYVTPWTRDASINVWNAAGLLLPEISRNTLLSVLTKDENGFRAGGEYWDAVIWVIGAWNYYLYTKDNEFLTFAYKVSENTLGFFENTEFDSEKNLFRGPACYGDGIAAYPDVYTKGGMSGIKSFVEFNPELKASRGVGIPMFCLSTNCLYYEAYKLIDKMADVLGYERKYELKAENMKNSINEHFWLEDKGYYRYIADDFGNCDYQEGMGHSFAILFGIANEEKTKKIFENQYLTEAGIACVWPTFKRYSDIGENEYGRHSGTVWPHIEGFFLDAAAKSERSDIFEKEFLSMTERALRDGHFAEIYHPTTKEMYGGLQENLGKGIRYWDSCIKQTWSATAYIRLIIRDILGMEFCEEGITFNPKLITGLENIKLQNVTYRGANLSVSIIGGGKNIKSITVNGIPKENFVPYGEENYDIAIVME